MAQVQPLELPESLLQTILSGEKSRELYEIQYISTVRPDPRDMDNIQPVSVTVRLWAVDARDALTQLQANPQYVSVNRQDHELPIRVLVSIGPVNGITEDSMLVTNEERAGRETFGFSKN